MSFRFSGPLLLAIVLSLSFCSGEQRSSAHSGNASSHAPRSSSFFYRMQASFILKETGEPIDFDYVAACGGVAQNYSYTTPSVFYTHHPIIVFQPVGDGHGLGLVTIDMCDDWKWEKVKFGPRVGQSRIPDDLRPLAIWFDDINDLSQGWGYKTDDAYEGPLAKIEFVKATVSVADKADWRAWREQAEASYQQIGALPGPWGYNYTQSEPRGTGWPTQPMGQYGDGLGIVGPGCPAVAKVRVNKDIIDAIFAKAPENVGRYWFATDAREIAPDEVEKFFSRETGVEDGQHLRDFFNSGNQYSGTLRRSGGGYIIPYREGVDDAQGFAYRDVYPFQVRSLAMPDLQEPQDTYYQKILLDPKYLGFGECSSAGYPIDTLDRVSPWLRGTEKSTQGPFDPEGFSKRHVLMIDDVPVDAVPSSMIGKQELYFVFDREGFVLGVDRW
jgi:hypothetical protein